jgi:hypothetical protein
MTIMLRKELSIMVILLTIGLSSIHYDNHVTRRTRALIIVTTKISQGCRLTTLLPVLSMPSNLGNIQSTIEIIQSTLGYIQST